MLAEKIRQLPTNVLTREQQDIYFEQGCLLLNNHVSPEWLERLRRAMDELVDRSRGIAISSEAFVLEEGHSPTTPRLHRVTNPQDEHPVFWEFFTSKVMVDLAADVVGPDVKFYHAKLNVKAGKSSGGFEWHQDIPGWPHTDYSPVTIGVYLNGCTKDQGPLVIARGTHSGQLHRMHDDAGTFTGIDPAVIAGLDPDLMLDAVGGPGTVVLLSCRVIHGSGLNRSANNRPLLLPVYSSADSFAYVTNPLATPRSGEIVRGAAARFASFDTRPCPMPPDWSRKKSMPWAPPAEPAARATA